MWSSAFELGLSTICRITPTDNTCTRQMSTYHFFLIQVLNHSCSLLLTCSIAFLLVFCNSFFAGHLSCTQVFAFIMECLHVVFTLVTWNMKQKVTLFFVIMSECTFWNLLLLSIISVNTIIALTMVMAIAIILVVVIIMKPALFNMHYMYLCMCSSSGLMEKGREGS